MNKIDTFPSINPIYTIRWQDEYERVVRYDGAPTAPIGLVRIEQNIERLVMDLKAS